jgi:phosphate transport system protein
MSRVDSDDVLQSIRIEASTAAARNEQTMPIDTSAELRELKRNILSMGALVEERFRMAVDSILNRDVEAAHIVRAGDAEIDRMEVNIEEECLRILALSAPVAGDLRFVLSIMRINTELERIADNARSISKRAIDLQRLERIELPEVLITMASATMRMLSDALIAMTENDTALARRVCKSDDRVDDLQKEIFVWVQEQIQQNIEDLHALLDLLSVARKLERVADMSTNICENVIFLSEGTVIKHHAEE